MCIARKPDISEESRETGISKEFVNWSTAKTPQTSFSPSEALSNEENRNMIDSLKVRKKKAHGMIAPNLKIAVTAPGKSGLNITKG